jgi:RNA polymerase sigma-70 factor (ECF subfamily)
VEATDQEFDRLMQQWQAGSPDAIATLFSRYSQHIRKAVRRRLNERLRPQFDSLDFVQDVWASVVALPPERHQFRTPDALLGFLARVASNKVIDVTRQRFHTHARDVNREQRLPDRPDNSKVAVQDPHPTPSQCMIGEEEWARIVGQFLPGHQAVLARLRDGYSQQEIAGMTGIHLRTVERIIRRLRELCES